MFDNLCFLFDSLGSLRAEHTTGNSRANSDCNAHAASHRHGYMDTDGHFDRHAKTAGS